MPALRATIERLDDVSEALRQFYIPKLIKGASGKDREVFCLNIVDLPTHPDAKALHSALGRAKQERDVLKKQTTSLLAGDGLRKHLIDAGCDPRLAPMAIAMLEPQLKTGEDGSGRLVLTGPSGMSLKDMVQLFMDSEDGQVCKRPANEQDNTDSGAPGGGGNRKQSLTPPERNPWSRHAWNHTMQGRILRENRARADELAIEAGHRQALGARFDEAR